MWSAEKLCLYAVSYRFPELSTANKLNEKPPATLDTYAFTALSTIFCACSRKEVNKWDDQSGRSVIYSCARIARCSSAPLSTCVKFGATHRVYCGRMLHISVRLSPSSVILTFSLWQYCYLTDEHFDVTDILFKFQLPLKHIASISLLAQRLPFEENGIFGTETFSIDRLFVPR